MIIKMAIYCQKTITSVMDRSIKKSRGCLFMNQSRTILAMLVIFLFGSANISFAVDLGDFPAPFIQGNEMRGYLVVGDRASAEDIVGVSDIAVSLQYAISGGSGSGRSNFSVS